MHFGCNTGNVITMAISTNHTAAQMQNLPYDFIMIPNPPGGSINATYMIGAYPTFILIKPDRSIPERDIWPISNTILRNKIIQHGGTPQACPSGEGTLDLIANPEEGGEVIGAGVYYYGFDVEINAIANDNWLFVNWTDEDGIEVSDEPLYNFVMPESDLALTANFQNVSGTNSLVAEKLLAVFPNPATDFLNVQVGNTLIGSDYVIYDYRGQIMLSGIIQSENFMIDLDNLSAGVYLFSIPNQMNETLRFIKR